MKKKARLAERKLKRKLKKSKSVHEDDIDHSQSHQKDNVPFWVQANEPPTFSVLPRKIGGNKSNGNNTAQAIALMRAAELAKGDTSDSNDSGDTTKLNASVSNKKDASAPGRKVKLKNLPMIQRRILGEERETAIELYRQKKLQSQSL